MDWERGRGIQGRRNAALGAAIVALNLLSNATASSDLGEVSVDDAVNMVRANRGSVVMFHLFASWCGPCRREFPDINRLAQEYRGKDFVLLAFSDEQDSRPLDQFLASMRLSFSPMRIGASEPGDLARAIQRIGGSYRQAIPYTAIYDRFGTLVREFTGGNSYEQYKSIIDHLLAAEGPKDIARPSSPPPANLNFIIRETPPFTFVQKRPNLYVLSGGGAAPQEASEEPIFMAGSAYAKSAIGDRKVFAHSRLRATGGVRDVSITATNQVTIDNLEGLECLAEGFDTDLNKPVSLYQVMLFDGNRYYLMQGFSPPAERDTHIRSFRIMALSFTRR